MYNTNKPDPDDLPSSAQLLRSTILAAIAAAVILVTIVLPAEYGIDPTRIGRVLGLAEMGEIKTQLAEEAEAHGTSETPQGRPAATDDRSSLFDALHDAIFSTAHAHGDWTDHVYVTLAPDEGAEVKLVMQEGDVVAYAWSVEGGVANYDLHGHGGDQEISYHRGRGVAGDEGEIVAAFTGSHGWFWRNRTDAEVEIVLNIRGDYSDIERTD